MYVWKPQENVNQSEEKQKNAIFFWKYVWLNWIKVKSSIVFQLPFAQSSKTIFATKLSQNNTVLDVLNLLIAVSNY